MKKWQRIFISVSSNFALTFCKFVSFVFFISIVGQVIPFWISVIIGLVIVGSVFSVFPQSNIVDAWFGEDVDEH